MKGHGSRREFLLAAGSVAASLGLAGVVAVRPARATPAAMQDAIGRVVGAARVTPGRVTLELPPLSENGNTVPLSVKVESPMTATDHVRAIHVFTEKNPRPEVISVHLGPRGQFGEPLRHELGLHEFGHELGRFAGASSVTMYICTLNFPK